MSCTANQSSPIQTISRCNLGTMFMSFELSERKWLLTLLSPGSDKMSKYTVVGGDWNTLIALLMQAKAKPRVLTSRLIVAIQEAGLDGFPVHRMLERNGVESTSRIRPQLLFLGASGEPRATGFDGETLLRTLMAWKSGEPRVCSMSCQRAPRMRTAFGSRVSGKRWRGGWTGAPSGSVARSATELRRFHFATVFWLMPSAWRGSSLDGRLRGCGAAVMAHSASFDSREKTAPSKPGIKQ